MTSKQQLTLFKFLAVSAALLYLYKLTKAQGLTMSGKYNPESIAGLGAQLLPEDYRNHATRIGVAVLKRYIH